jgi:hypothetical protein
LVEVELDLFEGRVISEVVILVLQSSKFLLNQNLFLLEVIKSFRAGVRVIVGFEDFLDLVEEFECHALTVLPITAFNLLE